MTEGKQLYDYLLSNVSQYSFEVFTMNREEQKDIEYVLVQVSNTHQVSYKDSQDRHQTDDFDVAVIICNVCSPYVPWDNILHLKYYLILISRRYRALNKMFFVNNTWICRDIYPKSEVERTLGKFQTVTHVSPLLTMPKQEKKSADFGSSHSKVTSSDTECETSTSVEMTSLSSNSDDKTDRKPVLKEEERPNSSSSGTAIKLESVNYLGYYSSHEQVMRQLILDCANMTQKQIRSMVAKGRYR